MNFTELSPRVLDLACAIQQIPAPTFAEQARAAFVREQFAAHGLADVRVDDLGNVYARRPGAGGPPVLVTAHLDTVFPAETPLTLTRTPGRIAGPGIGDNSLGVAGLFGLLWALQTETLPGDLWLAANVGEEGLGDLRGMRRVMEEHGATAHAIIVLEGMALGHVHHQAIAVRRYRFTARAEGGHSYLNFGRPSAIHALVRLAADLSRLDAPATPRTTFNIGTMHGGTSVNTIAREATLDLDLRSEDPATLTALIAQVHALAAAHAAPGITWEQTVISDRPAGRLPRAHPLVQLAIQTAEAAGLGPLNFEASSTDTNIPLSQGRPAVCIGLTHGANAHRPDEYIETEPLPRGLQALHALVCGAYQL